MPTTPQGYWTEGKIVNGINVGGGKFVTGTPPTPTTTPVAPAPVASTATVTTTPTRTPGLLADAETAAAAAANSRASAMQTAENYAANQRQLRIDAINKTFAPRIERAKEEGDARLSRVAALNFKTGVTGSGADTTRTAEQKGLNNKELQGIEDAKAMAINDAFIQADALGRQKAEDIMKASKEGADANLALYKSKADKALGILKTFAGQNVTAEKLKTADLKTYETLRDVSGMSDSAIDTYLKVNAPDGTYQWSAAQVNGNKLAVPHIVNGKVVMEQIDLGFTPSKKIKEVVKSSTGDGGYIVYEDSTITHFGSGTGGRDAEVIKDAQDAQAAIDLGADPDKVRRKFLDTHPTKGDFFLKYTKSQY